MAKETSKIESHEIVIEKINDKHALNNFKSYEKELVDFLIEKIDETLKELLPLIKEKYNHLLS